MKSWYNSKTLIFNLILLGVALSAPFISDDVRKYLIGATLPNIILRLKTFEKIGKK